MASFLKKLRTSSVPPMETEDSINSSDIFEYSFAAVYTGPPLNHSIPEIPTFKIDQIPIASIAPSLSHDFNVPVIQPLGKLHHKNKLKQKRTSSDSTVYPNLESHVVEIEASKSYVHVDLSENENPSSNLASSRIVDDVPTISDKIESGSGLAFGSTEICSVSEAEETVRTKHVKHPSADTFSDPESNCMVEIESDEFFHSSNVSVPVKSHAIRPGKKGSCYKCLKGNSLTEREVCIVCNAKYCRYCVIRAMGCMPEGRKCVGCIGYGINENNRRKLGKYSRMLKQSLSETMVDQIMKDERHCEVNQIPPELVQVNSQRLNREQLKLLLKCARPPKDLKPGCYWYDKAVGLWGKKGQPPCEIITPLLEVGGRLKNNASNGNTNVTINDRVITKKEKLVLKMAGVSFEGTSHFWVNPDGSYSEEGQKNYREHVWNKVGTKVACTILSLPVRSKSEILNYEVETAKKLDLPKKRLQNILLVGSVNSGACNIFKQAKLLYNAPFSETELQNIKLVIQSNLFTYLGILLEAREDFEEESLLENRKRLPYEESTSFAAGNSSENVDITPYAIGKRLKGFSDWLLTCMLSGNMDAIFLASLREYGPMVKDLWRDEAIQATYNRRNELKVLPKSAYYFLDRAIEISKVDYEPSVMDILNAEGMSLSNSLTSMEFSFPKTSKEESLHPEYQHDSSLRYQLISVHPKSLGNYKWLEMFEDTDVVLFSVSLTDYDEYIVDNKGVATNKMLVSKNLFEYIIDLPTFQKKKFLLILTKLDLLDEKIEHASLKKCEWFSGFNPVITHNKQKDGSNGNMPSLAQIAFQYIAIKFKRLFHSLTGKNLFVSLVNELEPDTIDEALRYGREVIEWEKWDPSIVYEMSENTSTSVEEASSS